MAVSVTPKAPCTFEILPCEEQILQFGACRHKTDLRILVILDNAVC